MRNIFVSDFCIKKFISCYYCKNLNYACYTVCSYRYLRKYFYSSFIFFCKLLSVCYLMPAHGYLTQCVLYKFIPRISHSTLYCFKVTLILYSYNIIILTLCQISQIFNYRFVFISFAVILFLLFANKTAFFNIFFIYKSYF